MKNAKNKHGGCAVATTLLPDDDTSTKILLYTSRFLKDMMENKALCWLKGNFGKVHSFLFVRLLNMRYRALKHDQFTESVLQVLGGSQVK